MKILIRLLCLLYMSLVVLSFQKCRVKNNAASVNVASRSATPSYYTMDDFKSVDKIIIHTHIKVYDTTFIKEAAASNFRLQTVNVNSPSSPPIEEQQDIAVRLVQEYPHWLSYATTFSVKNFNDEDWQQQTINYLKASFNKGAKAVKVWKNVGLELKDKDGKFVMIDNPRFDPILDFIAKNNITLIGHLGEPRNCWLPVEKMTVKGDKKYFSEHPEYHMYLHPEYPSYEDQINARDRMLEKHPDLRFVGAHLGSLEWSVDELAKRLDRFPNMAVDMAERISHLQYQAVTDWRKVHDFFIKYQDRLIYATDQTVNGKVPPAEFNKEAREVWLRHWRFFTTDETMRVPKVEQEFKGLKLPREVVDKIYRKNAEKWFGLHY
jgi:predicted TIM-barrel fold metal-dependent hydrolase